MGSLEPVRLLRKAVLVTSILSAASVSLLSSATAHAGTKNQGHFESFFNLASGSWQSISGAVDAGSLVQKAERIMNGAVSGHGVNRLLGEDSLKFVLDRAVGDKSSTSVKFKQIYRGLEVFGGEAAVHFDQSGEAIDSDGDAVEAFVNTNAVLSADDAVRIVADRANYKVRTSVEPKLLVFKDFDGAAHLAYHVLTRSTRTYDGQELFIDAHSGEVLLDTPRAYDARGARTIYSADTEEAHKHIDDEGAPTDIDLNWYQKLIEDGNKLSAIDDSARRAYLNSGKVYRYYDDNFNRKSFDGKDTRLVSVVHMGKNFNNAFWTSEYSLMAYGDGDGEILVDTTLGLDVAAHEMTHGVTSASAGLVYAKESGAMNESFSDVFGKLVDFKGDGNWYIGAEIVGPKLGRKAIRNMKNPEEFKQPGTNDSPYRVPTPDVGPCLDRDHCGVHRNSGIPNRAAVLIIESIGKEKAEQIYYKVLTQRLKPLSKFKDLRLGMEGECANMFGPGSQECQKVSKAFDTVKIAATDKGGNLPLPKRPGRPWKW